MSNNATTLPSRRGSDEKPPHPLWIAMVTVAFVAFTVPYTTNMIQWAHVEGFFPLRPAFYLVITAFACIVLVIGKKPDFTLTSIVVLLFHLAYLFDATVLRRFEHPSGEMYAMMTHGALFLAIFTLTWFLGVIHRFTHLPILIAAALTVIIGSFSNIAEWFGVYDFSIVMGRAAGFHGDPNNSSIAIILALAVFLTLSKNMWHCFALVGLSFIAVAITLSRSGLIAEILICGCYLVVSYRKQPAFVTKALLVTVPAVIAVVVYFVSHMDSAALRESDIQDRLGALLGKDSQKMASGERMKDLNDGIQAVRLQPVSGYGVGAGTEKWQPHNQLVAIWIDGGVVFAALFLFILGSIALKCAALRGRGGLCFLALLIFIPFSQILHTYIGFWITTVILINITSTRFYSIQWFKATSALPTETASQETLSNSSSEYA